MPAFDDGGFLPLEFDPKTTIALENLDAFPVDVNAADRDRLLRVPGIGPTSAGRILQNRRRHTIDAWRDLQAMGVVKSWAWPFLAFPGHRPPRARQTRLDFSETRDRIREGALTSAASPLSPIPTPTAHPEPVEGSSALPILTNSRYSLSFPSEIGNPTPALPPLHLRHSRAGGNPSPDLTMASAPCGLPRSCAGCSLRGSPGHPN